jgi:hypothetical protein
MWGSLKDKVYKTNPHTLEELRRNICHEIWHFLGKNSRKLTPVCSAGTLSAFGQEDNIFSICCSSGEFLFYFVSIILTVVAYHQDKHRIRLPSPTEILPISIVAISSMERIIPLNTDRILRLLIKPISCC